MPLYCQASKIDGVPEAGNALPRGSWKRFFVNTYPSLLPDEIHTCRITKANNKHAAADPVIAIIRRAMERSAMDRISALAAE